MLSNSRIGSVRFMAYSWETSLIIWVPSRHVVLSVRGMPSALMRRLLKQRSGAAYPLEISMSISLSD